MNGSHRKYFYYMTLLTPFSINSSPLSKLYSIEDLNNLPETEDHSKMELINGILYLSPLPLPEHNRTIEKIDLFLKKHIIAGKCNGVIFRPRAGILSGKNTWLEPDLFFLNSETEKKFRSSHPTTADLVIEVLSESTREYDRKTKADTYLILNVRELWLVDSTNQTIEVRENPEGKSSWERIALYTWGEVLVSPVLDLSIDTQFLGMEPD